MLLLSTSLKVNLTPRWITVWTLPPNSRTGRPFMLTAQHSSTLFDGNSSVPSNFLFFQFRRGRTSERGRRHLCETSSYFIYKAAKASEQVLFSNHSVRLARQKVLPFFLFWQNSFMCYMYTSLTNKSSHHQRYKNFLKGVWPVSEGKSLSAARRGASPFPNAVYALTPSSRHDCGVHIQKQHRTMSESTRRNKRNLHKTKTSLQRSEM